MYCSKQRTTGVNNFPGETLPKNSIPGDIFSPAEKSAGMIKLRKVAETTQEIVTQFKTQYCNERVDEFFNLSLSKLSALSLEAKGRDFL